MIFGLFGGDKKRAAELYEAASNGDLQGVRQALEKGADINALDPKCAETALHVAVEKSHVAVVELLLAKGANPDIVSNQHFTPLIIAAAMGDAALPMVELLIAGKANLALAPTDGPNAGGAPLHIAASKGANAVLKHLLAAGTPPVALPNGSTLMHMAAIGGNAETVEIASKAGISVNTTDSQMRTSLHLTAITGNMVAAEEFIKLGAALECRDNEDCTPLMRAVLNNQAAIVSLLLKNAANPDIVFTTGESSISPLYAAAINGYDEVVKLLLDAGVQVSKKIGGLASVVDMAQQAGHQTTVALLKEAVRKGKAVTDAVKAEKKAGKLQSDLSAAIQSLDGGEIRRLAGDKLFKHLPLDLQLLAQSILGDAKQITKLVAAGANPKAQFDDLADGINPLYAAVLANDFASVEALLNEGADVNSPRSDGATALMAAVNNGNNDIAKLMLARGANVNASKEGATALMLAAANNKRSLVDALLAAGADINAIHPEIGLGAFGFALDNMRMHLAKHLLEQGARPDFGKAETLPLAVAEHGSLELIKAIEVRGGSIIRDDMKGRVAFVAARNKDGSVLDYVLEHGADLSHGNNFNYTPLTLSTLYNHVALVKRFLERGDDPNSLDADNESALSLAIERQHQDIVDLLRKHRAETKNYTGLSGEEAILKAATDGALGSILELHDQGVSLNATDGAGNSPLMLAAQMGFVGVMRSLYHLGADINHHNNANFTAADLAKQASQEKALRSLMELGAEGAVKLVYGIDGGEAPTVGIEDVITGRVSHPGKERLPYDEDSEEEQSDEIEDYEDSDDESDPVELDHELANTLMQLEELIDLPHIAERLSDDNKEVILERIALIRERGPDALPEEAVTELVELAEMFSNVPEEEEAPPPLFAAATDGDLKALRKELKDGGDLNSTLPDGTTLLMVAVQNNHDSVVRELLKLGVDVNQRRDDSFTALLFASFMGHENAVKLLAEHGANINIGHSISSSQGASGGQTALTVAAQRKNLSMCKLLVKLGADVNAVTEAGYTPLMWSLANAADSDVAKFLLQAGANPDPDVLPEVSFATANTPLILAATNGLLDIVKELIRQGVRIDKTDGDGWTALKRATDSEHVDVVNALIKAGASVNIADHDGWTVIMNASGKGNLETVKSLIKAGADINAQSKSGVTALSQAVGARADAKALNSLSFLRQMFGGGDDGENDAASEPSLDLIKLLLKHGANPNVQRDGSPLIEEAQSNDDDELISVLVKHGAGQVSQASPKLQSEADLPGHQIDEQSEALLQAVKSADIELVKSLIADGANPNYVSADGQYTLSEALTGMVVKSLPRLVRRNFREIADFLLSKGVDVNVQGVDPTPLGLAALLGDMYFVNVMLKCGANVDVQLIDMGTPLLAAIGEKHEDCAMTLIAAGASLEAKLPNGISVLHGAAEMGLTQVVDAVLEKHPGIVNSPDSNGFTPLMSAARSGQEAIVRQLLRFNADVSLQADSGNTAKDYALEASHSAIAALL